jgi:hypothetical protein
MAFEVTNDQQPAAETPYFQTHINDMAFDHGYFYFVNIMRMALLV